MAQVRVEIPNDTMFSAVTEILSEGREVVVMTKGASMRPFIEGLKDSVVLKRKERYDVGDIVLAYTDNNLWVLHRLIRTGNGKSILKGDGNLDGTEVCSNDNISGCVKEILHPRCRTDCTTGRFAAVSALWRKTPRLLRRVVLGIYRRLAKTR